MSAAAAPAEAPLDAACGHDNFVRTCWRCQEKKCAVPISDTTTVEQMPAARVAGCIRVQNTIFKREDVERVWLDGKSIIVKVWIMAPKQGWLVHRREEFVFECRSLAEDEMDRIARMM